MKLTKIKIENLGEIESFEMDIKTDIVTLPQREYQALLLGLSRVASNRLFYDVLDREMIKPTTHVCGEFVFDREVWSVESTFNLDYEEKVKGGRVIRYGQKLEETYYKNGVKQALTSSEYSALRISVDENARFWFNNGRKIDGEDAERKRHWIIDCDFQTFFKDTENEFFLEQISLCQPLPINTDKRLYTAFDKNGVLCPMRIEGENFEIAEDLSESDKTIFNYLCFITVNRIMFAYETYKGWNLAKKSLFVFNFTEYLDENVNVADLLKYATDMGCQVFLFLNDLSEGYE